MHTYPPPAGYVQPASFSFNAASDWARIVKRGIPSESYQGEPTMRLVRGDCLNPLLIEGEHALLIRPLAPNERLVDGDLYVIEWTNADELAAFRDTSGRPAATNLIAKFLRYIGGQWFTQCKYSLGELDGGVVVGKVIDTVSLSYGTHSAETGQIANGAITDSYDAVFTSGPVAAAGGTAFGIGTFNVPALAVNATVKVRVEYETHGNASGGGSDNAYYDVGAGKVALTNQIRQTWFVISGDNEGSQVTNVSSISFVAGQSPTFGVTITTGAGTGSRNVKNIRYTVLVLKK